MVRRKPLSTAGAVIVLVMLAAAVGADVISPYGFAETSLRERFIAMNGAHWLGTDQLGRDLLTRLIHGARVSLYVGFGAVLIGSVLATAIGDPVRLLRRPRGHAGAARRGRVDGVPAAAAADVDHVAGRAERLNITIVLGVAFGIQNSRVVRGVALGIKENTYIESARAMGSGHLAIATRHILPNTLPTIIVVATTGLSTVILDRGEPVVPGARRAAAVPDVGRHALARGSRPHVPGAVAGDLAGGGAVARRVRLQHAGRRAARPARPAIERRLGMAHREAP